MSGSFPKITITPTPIEKAMQAGDPIPGADQSSSLVPASVGLTFAGYTTALGQAVPANVNRARAALRKFGQATR